MLIQNEDAQEEIKELQTRTTQQQEHIASLTQEKAQFKDEISNLQQMEHQQMSNYQRIQAAMGQMERRWLANLSTLQGEVHIHDT